MDISILEIHEKVKSIRTAEELGRSKFAQRTNIAKRTLEAIENRGTDPRSSFIKGVCKAFPEYSLWIMTNEINLNSGQISPDVKKIWNQKQEKLDSLSDELIPFDRFNLEHIHLIKNIIKETKNLITDAIDTTDRLEEEYAKAFHKSQSIDNKDQNFKFYSPEEIKLFEDFDKKDSPIDLIGLFKEVLNNTKAQNLTYDNLLKLIKKKRTKS